VAAELRNLDDEINSKNNYVIHFVSKNDLPVALPGPGGAFTPMLRLYWPQENLPSVLDGTWLPPVIQKS